jgi:hypothetical protein
MKDGSSNIRYIGITRNSANGNLSRFHIAAVVTFEQGTLWLRLLRKLAARVAASKIL